MRKAVIVMGYNIEESNFENVVWGKPPLFPGRLVKGAAVFLEEKADIFFITGCGEREKKEGVEIMRDMLFDRVDRLESFTKFAVFQNHSYLSILKMLESAILLERRKPGERIQTTSKTMQNLRLPLLSTGVEKIIIVSSPDHVSRCIRDAQIFWGETKLIDHLSVTSSATMYSKGDAKMENVVVIEPSLFLGPGRLAQELVNRRKEEGLLKKIQEVLNEGV
jgi:hypothetical protein